MAVLLDDITNETINYDCLPIYDIGYHVMIDAPDMQTGIQHFLIVSENLVRKNPLIRIKSWSLTK